MNAIEFVRNIWDSESYGAYAEVMDLETAKTDLKNYVSDGVNLPAELTPELYMHLWNDLVISSACEVIS